MYLIYVATNFVMNFLILFPHMVLYTLLIIKKKLDDKNPQSLNGCGQI